MLQRVSWNFLSFSMLGVTQTGSPRNIEDYKPNLGCRLGEGYVSKLEEHLQKEYALIGSL